MPAELAATADRVEALLREAERERSAGCTAEARSKLRRVLELAPTSAAAHLLLGSLGWDSGSWQEAVGAFDLAITYAERAGEAGPAADGWHNMGIVLAAMGRREEALAAYRRALEWKPDHAATYASLGRESLLSGQEALAERFLRQALLLAPGDREARRNLSLSQRRRGLPAEAVASARALADGGNATDDELETLAIALTLHGDREGPRLFERLVDRAPGDAGRRWRWSEALLLHGDYAAGWREYRRWLELGGSRVDAPRGFTQPVWRGEPLAGRTIMLYAEQGLGDTLQFARYAPLVAARGGRVVLEVQAALVRLLARVEGVEVCVARGEPLEGAGLPGFDVCAPLTSLPAIFDSRLERLPPPVRLMDCGGADRADGPSAERAVVDRVDVDRDGRDRAAFEQTAAASERAAAGDIGSDHVRPKLRTLRVGLAWAGNKDHWNDRLRSLPAKALAGLAGVGGVEWVSLQVGAHESGPLPWVASCAGVMDFADTAEIVAGLDLVITVDTSIAHLAGSLGKPIWIVLGRVVDWRWGLTGERTPWYPSARLFRQGAGEEWEEVMARVREELEGMKRPNNLQRS